jgi:hypothetical protein
MRVIRCSHRQAQLQSARGEFVSHRLGRLTGNLAGKEEASSSSLFASSIIKEGGLFKWRQFEPEVILRGRVVLALFPFVPRRRGVARRAGPARRSRHSLEVGPALRPGTGAATAPTAQGNQRLLAGG